MVQTEDALPVDDFIHELNGIRGRAAKAILRGDFGRPPLGGTSETEASRRPEVIFLLQLGVYPEWRETHLLSRQMQRIDEPSLLRRVGQQIADEAKHAEVLCSQLSKWGADPKRFYREPIYEWSSSFDYMDRLTTPVEYFAVSNFIGEGLFLPTLLAPLAKYDPETFAVYVEHILPDEPSHVRLGRDFIFHYCRDWETQQRVRQHAQIVTKQYCIGFEAAIRFAHGAAIGKDPMAVRDVRYAEAMAADDAAPNEMSAVYEGLVREFDI